MKVDLSTTIQKDNESQMDNNNVQLMEIDATNVTISSVGNRALGPTKLQMSQNDPAIPSDPLPPVKTTKLPLSEPVKQNEIREPSRTVLEDFTSFSKCHLWKLMMSFYDRQGVDSWAQGIVPHFITSNAFIGHSYAKVLLGFLRDCMSPQNPMALDTDEPLYIVELGAGSGKFSHFMIQSLIEMKELCAFPFHRIKYIMTDFTEQNFNFWTTHPALKQHVEAGLIDFAIFDATSDQSLHLHHAKIVLNPESLVNPVVIVANYLFDTLYHDLFQVQGQSLRQGLVSVGSKREEEPDPLDPGIIKRLSNQYAYPEITSDFYATEDATEAKHEDALKFMLQWYQKCYSSVDPGATFLVPIGALGAIRRLMSISNERVVVISGDKGHNNPDHFHGLSDPHIAVHGSFSVMVNYHAVGLYFAHMGGIALHNPQEEASLKVSVFVLDSSKQRLGNQDQDLERECIGNEDALESVFTSRARAFPHLRDAFTTHLSDFGPNDFFVLQQSLKNDTTKPSLKAVIALLKLSHWDPDVFYKFRDVVLDQVPNCGSKLRRDFMRGIPRLWSNYYMLDQDKDIAFEIGRFFYGMREYRHAIEYYGRSLSQMGKHHVTFHNMGLCHYSQNQLSLAHFHFKQALEMNPKYEKAQTWMERTQLEMDKKQKLKQLVDVDPEEVQLRLNDQHVRFVQTPFQPTQ